jgi:hypothetical protein
MLTSPSYTQALPVLTISSYAISGLKKTSKMWNNILFETHANIFLAGKDAPWDEGGDRLLLGDNTGGVAVMLRSIGFIFQLDPLLHTHIFLVDHVYIQSRLAQNSVFTVPSETLTTAYVEDYLYSYPRS